jgi:phosphocarrier protein NPr
MPVMERTVMVVNTKGLHAKCASQLVEVARPFSSEISLHRDTVSANVKSIIGLMLLEAIPGTELLVRAQGNDAEEALNAIEALFVAGFNE